jgi:hypothetical protein
MTQQIVERPPAWATLARAVRNHKAVRVIYHGRERVLCPHALGWRNGRAKVLSYQSGGNTSDGPLPPDRTQRWRSMFVDEIEDAVIADDQWVTASNYAATFNGMDRVEVEVGGGLPQPPQAA